MADISYTSIVRVERHGGPDRTAELPGGERVAFGVHGAVAEHYGVDMTGRDPVSTTLDYIVAAAGG